MEVSVQNYVFDFGANPAGWVIRPLKEVGKWYSGGTPSMKNAAYWSGDIPWISPKDMKASRLHDSIDHISQQAVADGTRLIPKHSVLMVIRGMILAHSFPVARAERSLAFNQDIKAVVVTDDFDSDFALHWLIGNAQKLRGLTAESTHGTKRLPPETLYRVPFPQPAKVEQAAIAEALNDADELIGSMERLLAKKRLLNQGAMQQLLTGKKRLPGFSGDWKVLSLNDLFSFSGGFTASRDQLSAEGHCYLHYGDIHAAKKTFIDVKSEAGNIPRLDIPLKKVNASSLLEDGDIVFVDASEDDEGASRHVVIVNPNRVPFILYWFSLNWRKSGRVQATLGLG